MIISPISGILGKLDLTEGETATMGVEVASVISDKKFQIEVYVPEVDVAKVKVGNPAEVTLDAYGSDTTFNASVISLDKGETIVGGVTAYKAIIEFTDNDERIMSGMTANVDIKGEIKAQVVAVPQRAIISDDGKKFLDILKDEEVVRVEVKTGFKGSDGYVEIIDGLSAGEKILFSVSK
jgi:HlyD family secretion protein